MKLKYLVKSIKWNPVQEDICECFDQTESRVYDPVSKPFSIIFFARGFNSFDTKKTYEQNDDLRSIGGIEETDEICKQSSSPSNH